MRVTPDGRRYLRMAAGEREPLPFHQRWLLPFVCRQSALMWWLVTWSAYVLVLLGTALLAQRAGASREQVLLAAGLVGGLPANRFALAHPVLVDLPTLAFALAVAVAHPHEPHLALGLLVLGSMASEKVPVWSAIFAAQPIFLAALAVPLVRNLVIRPGEIRVDDPFATTLRKPLTTGLDSHRAFWCHPLVMLLPWGACLLALWAPTPWMLLALIVGYAQLLVATDTVRLYQQAAPLVAVQAALVCPPEWVAPVLVLHWFNPWRGNGV